HAQRALPRPARRGDEGVLATLAAEADLVEEGGEATREGGVDVARARPPFEVGVDGDGHDVALDLSRIGAGAADGRERHGVLLGSAYRYSGSSSAARARTKRRSERRLRYRTTWLSTPSTADSAVA